MCSINGFVDFREDARRFRHAVTAAGEKMAHRGPDAFGVHVFRGVCFYHNRLSVMDPARGKQPMSATFHGRRYTIVYKRLK